ncbi:uncharacterized protein LOC123327316 [Drosophila simulans]|uniref:uncharacterized protein LOC123327316 n=1 Tax=Drosophila simulans TaxID=7240 RepID=UPI001D0FA26C|nr:uncharacterized protein LOC123327316 [Drosophila simulans]
MKAPIQLHASRLTRSLNLSLSSSRSLSLSLSEFCECTFWPSGNGRLHVCVSASVRRTRLQRSAQLWQAGFSFIVRRLERFASVPAPLIWIWIRILGFSVSRLHASSDSRFLGYLDTPIVGYSRQTRLLCEILHSPPWPDGRFLGPTDLGSDRKRRSLLQRCRRRCLRSCVLVTSVFDMPGH